MSVCLLFVWVVNDFRARHAEEAPAAVVSVRWHRLHHQDCQAWQSLRQPDDLTPVFVFWCRVAPRSWVLNQ
jgi:hypothetical protein